jgi:hypothetical protein
MKAVSLATPQASYVGSSREAFAFAPENMGQAYQEEGLPRDAIGSSVLVKCQALKCDRFINLVFGRHRTTGIRRHLTSSVVDVVARGCQQVFGGTLRLHMNL